MDRLYRVTFMAKPILVHAPSAERAREIAIEYARQPDTARILVEEGEKAQGQSASS